MKDKLILIKNVGYMDRKGIIYHDEIDLACHLMTNKQYSKWQEDKEGGIFNNYFCEWLEKKTKEIKIVEKADELIKIIYEWGLDIL